MCPLDVKRQPMMGAKFGIVYLSIVALALTVVSVFQFSAAHSADRVKISVKTSSCQGSGSSRECSAPFSYAGRQYLALDVAHNEGAGATLYVKKSSMHGQQQMLDGRVVLGSGGYSRHDNAWILYLATVVVWAVILLLGYAMLVRRRRGLRVSRM